MGELAISWDLCFDISMVLPLHMEVTVPNEGTILGRLAAGNNWLKSSSCAWPLRTQSDISTCQKIV